MITEAKTYKQGDVLDHTPVSALTAGQVIQVGGRAAVALTDIAAGVKGSVVIKGLVAVRNTAVAGNVGDNVWWDENGTGVDTNTGACTVNAVAGDFWIGVLAKALAATDTYAIVDLNAVNPYQPAWATRYHIADTTGTLDNTDGGVVHHIQTADQTITLPEIATVAIGTEVIIINDMADASGSTGLRVAPHANDGFNGYGITHAVNKYLTNTAATGVRGDYLRLLACGDTHWQVLEKRGIWARQA